MARTKQISIILPSFRDARIISAIASIRMFDDIGTVQILVIDGGSDPALVEAIRENLTADDLLLSEPDEGIFDGLNKGLDRVETPFVGWLGSDDMFTGAVKASEVVAQLQTTDIFIAALYIASKTRIRRLNHAHYAAMGLARFGLHNPHFSTFGRASLFCARRFDKKSIAADIGYFIDIFAQAPRISSTRQVATISAEGGYSNQSLAKIIKVNTDVFLQYKVKSNGILAFASVSIKIAYKSLSYAYYRLRPMYWDKSFPELLPLMFRSELK